MDDVVRKKLLETEAGKPVLDALTTFLEDNAYLLQMDANERSVTHRFAMHLQQQLPKLHVDCEYNRDGVNPKRISHFYLDPTSEDTEAKTVFPDVIAHIRDSKENYLVIEVKKTTNTVSRDIDFAKLRGYKGDLNYRFALFIEFVAGKDAAGVSYVEWVDG